MHLPLDPCVEAGVAILDGEGLQARAQQEDDLCYRSRLSLHVSVRHSRIHLRFRLLRAFRVSVL
jgi:hypothetical protein